MNRGSPPAPGHLRQWVGCHGDAMVQLRNRHHGVLPEVATLLRERQGSASTVGAIVPYSSPTEAGRRSPVPGLPMNVVGDGALGAEVTLLDVEDAEGLDSNPLNANERWRVLRLELQRSPFRDLISDLQGQRP